MTKNQELEYLKRRKEKMLRIKRRFHSKPNNQRFKNDSETTKNGLVNTLKFNSRKIDRVKHKYRAPDHFSITENEEETVGYFNQIIDHLSHDNKISFAFDMKNIKRVTSDAIMYILALMYSTKVDDKEFEIGGYLPESKELKDEFNKAGFIDFLRKRKSSITRNTNQVTIQSGNDLNRASCKLTCDFVINKFDLSKHHTRFIYGILSELMLNTYQHAYYKTEDCFKREWYLYCEHKDDKIEFIFLDTGLGIPSTVSKNFFELIKEHFMQDEHKLIESAMNGAFRSRTKEKHRGRGLPEIKDCFDNNRIKDLKVISGKGVYEPNNKAVDLENEFNGTLFYWNVDKNCFFE